ncbi:MAG: aspartate carbamoyltransferase regulatory subunit [Spirochaetaceae bacterium]|jgi:aspartate carbamoyltransferase regulatory subunit|nr:aspartate carbamoyltransferase regulatory subunit [Spirochaetaceae bacterium]
MLIIEKIRNGIVIDHIKAGQGLRIFEWLGLHKLPYTTAFVLNAPSERRGKKDIIKIYDTIALDCTILGLIDPHITVNIIENEDIKEKIALHLPDRVVNVLRCKNPRCITSTEQYIPHIFHLENEITGIYRCEYCEEARNNEDFW